VKFHPNTKPWQSASTIKGRHSLISTMAA